jgi:hypothetical protein
MPFQGAPHSVKGTYIRTCTISATMSPPVRVDVREFAAKAVNRNQKLSILTNPCVRRKTNLTPKNTSPGSMPRRSSSSLITRAEGGQFTELRKRLFKAGAEVHVVKNSIFRIAAKEAGVPT